MEKRFGRIKSYEEWRKPKLVENAIELLRGELSKQRGKIESVQLCFSTDPFMYRYPEVRAMTIKILELLNEFGISATVLTKGVYPKELGRPGRFNPQNQYGITLVSVDEEFRKKFEPFAAPIKSRLEALRMLHKKGQKTWISIEPYPPPNIFEQDLKELLSQVAFADRIVFGRLNYNATVSQFKGFREFYMDCVRQVIDFCTNAGIDCHIKRDTLYTGGKNQVAGFEVLPYMCAMLVTATKDRKSKIKPSKQTAKAVLFHPGSSDES
jgi:hypothetical protein